MPISHLRSWDVKIPHEALIEWAADAGNPAEVGMRGPRRPRDGFGVSGPGPTEAPGLLAGQMADPGSRPAA